ncbi:uncharacterized protein BXZ73DRAFT_98073 [Epithele typhae]|uniref:uncharacterized protein n=1 Tax=Epithele typhae TaxID=378194 RepID=UPI00200885D3|nr:uncharacterized protein BXZ73DRAFT_98073 [Epithele typhae]KAH9941684.1 hypothetical protein BXZ73DRAFT_98073 [Epithele typhae]
MVPLHSAITRGKIRVTCMHYRRFHPKVVLKHAIRLHRVKRSTYDDLSALPPVPNATVSTSYSALYPRHAINTTADPSRGSIPAPNPSGTACSPQQVADLTDSRNVKRVTFEVDETEEQTPAVSIQQRKTNAPSFAESRRAAASSAPTTPARHQILELISSNQATGLPLSKPDAMIVKAKEFSARRACELAEAAAGRHAQLTSREGKGAPKIMIALLGKDDLYPLAHLMNSS